MSKSFCEDLTGQRFGRLTVMEFVPNDKQFSYWECKCDCRNTCIIQSTSLKSGATKSCGCLKKEKAKEHGAATKKHGMCGTRIYRTYSGMKSRCYNQHDEKYKHYGGRGITVCDEWRNDFMSFYNWSMQNGYTDELTIDRIDVNGNYEPGNCRWVDMKTQQRNKRNNVIVEYQSEVLTLPEAAEKSGLNAEIVKNRYYRGDRGNRLFRPKKTNKHHNSGAEFFLSLLLILSLSNIYLRKTKFLLYRCKEM